VFATIAAFIYQGTIPRRQHNILNNNMQYFYPPEIIHVQNGFIKKRETGWRQRVEVTGSRYGESVRKV